MSVTQFQKWINVAAIAGYLAASSAAVADDTEVFFTQQYRDTSKPNILFVMDTSGSMDSRPSGQTSGPSKMDIVKNALTDLLDSMTNVNVGLARFTVPGGPIVQPVLDIDAPADPVLSATIGDGNDDAEEDSDGGMNITSPDLDIFQEADHSKWVAIRLRSVDIPQGATINKAVLNLTAYGNASGAFTIRIFGEDSDNAAAFANSDFNISSRAMTDAYKDWAPTSWSDRGRYSVDISNIIQEITSRANWCGGNSIVLMMRREGTGSNRRTAYSYETASPVNFDRMPKLNVQFSGTLPEGADGCYVAQTVATLEAGTDDVEERHDEEMRVSNNALSFSSSGTAKAVGLRFVDLRVPQDAEIIDSYLRFRNNTGTSYNDGNTSVRVYGIDQDDFGGWTSDSGLVVDEGLTGDTLDKTAHSDIVLPNWPRNQTVGHSGNLNTVITAVTGRAEWESGNALGLILVRQSGAQKKASSFEGRVAATLTVRYKATFTSGTYTVRDEMKRATAELSPEGWTPLADTMLEAGLYYRGENVLFGKTRQGSANNRVSKPDSKTMQTMGTHDVPSGCDPILDPLASACADEELDGEWVYKSPITDVCEDNFIVYLTDGEPTWLASDTQEEYARITEEAECSAGDTVDDDGSNVGEECLIGLAKHYFEKDQSDALPGVQNIKSYFIGFDISLDLLNDAAAAGGTTASYEANDAETLATALSDIIDSISIRTNTFVTAGVTVNQTNRLTHLDQLYFAIFAPDITPRWPGNLKRYKLGEGGVLKDFLDADAVDPDSDQFLESAQSWWSGFADGNDPKAGGAASKLTASRPLYTNVAGTSNITIKDPGNIVHETNTLVTETMLAVDASERSKVLQWARGVDVMDEDKDGNLTEANYVFGDPLHSRPALINYKDTAPEGKLRVFVSTNRGELHAINPVTGVEEWAFVPKELLPHYQVLMNNPESTAKLYGLDASIVPFLQDQNRDGQIDVSAGDKAWIYVGMRRGGTSYYAFDVTNPDAPKLMFVIAKGAESTDSFYKLGQTWSHPIIGRAKVGDEDVKPVMIFGGGYDTTQDDTGAPQNDTEGNVVYIADAATGAELWSSDEITDLGMNKSVPADIAAIDLNGDRRIDHIYAADMGAQIWRFDLAADGAITGGLLAKLQPDAATETDNRRFYGGVDVGLIQNSDGERDVVIAAGSGFRERPLDKAITDHFYVFRDEGIYNGEINLVRLTNLVNITTLIGDTDPDDDYESDAIEAIETQDAVGWYYDFSGLGEKNLTAPVIFDNQVLFTTYVPPSETELENDCGGAAGTGRFYVLQIEDGNPVKDRDGNNLLGDGDRFQEIPDCPTCGFVPPQLLFTDDDIIGLIGTKPVDIDALRERVKRVKWRHNQQ